MSNRTISIIIAVALVAAGVAAFLASKGTADSERTTLELVKWHSFNEGIELAHQQNKKLLIDVYTDWCIWCKKMDKDVYTNEDVGKAITTSFVAVKLNAESSNSLTYNGDQTDEATFAKAIGVTGYPTTVFLESGAQPITKIAGYLEPKEFANVLRFIGENHYKTKTFEEFKSTLGNHATQ
jgi:thioredoxin-related protein